MKGLPPSQESWICTGSMDSSTLTTIPELPASRYFFGACQRVLVASTNNRAVDEIHERCERIRPGLVLRSE